MNLIATMPVRNEAWILGASLRAALKWVDSVVVMDHCSTDETSDIIEQVANEHPGRVARLYQDGSNWSEMAHRQRLLNAARQRGATHIAIVDADEILTSNLVGSIRDQIASLPPGGVIQAGMPAPWRSLDQYRVDPCIWSNRIDLALAFADHPNLCWRATNGYDHHHREPHGARVAFRGYGMNGGVMHLQWASWRRLTSKHRFYKLTERLKYPDKSVSEIDQMYSLALNEHGLTVQDCPPEWWSGHAELRQFIDLDAEPWHERECAKILKDNPSLAYGLNLFDRA
jgi:hypothetical protein